MDVKIYGVKLGVLFKKLTQKLLNTSRLNQSPQIYIYIYIYTIYTYTYISMQNIKSDC